MSVLVEVGTSFLTPCVNTLLKKKLALEKVRIVEVKYNTSVQHKVGLEEGYMHGARNLEDQTEQFSCRDIGIRQELKDAIRSEDAVRG